MKRRHTSILNGSVCFELFKTKTSSCSHFRHRHRFGHYRMETSHFSAHILHTVDRIGEIGQCRKTPFKHNTNTAQQFSFPSLVAQKIFRFADTSQSAKKNPPPLCWIEHTVLHDPSRQMKKVQLPLGSPQAEGTVSKPTTAARNSPRSIARQ